MKNLTGGSTIFPFVSTPISSKMFRHPLIGVDFVDMSTFHGLNILQFAGFSEILLIGIDNTYPHCVYSDQDNRALLLEEHAFSAPFMKDFSQHWSVADLIADALEIYDSFNRFDSHNVLNCDPLSLLDTFKKSDKFNLIGRYYEK